VFVPWHSHRRLENGKKLKLDHNLTLAKESLGYFLFRNYKVKNYKSYRYAQKRNETQKAFYSTKKTVSKTLKLHLTAPVLGFYT